MGEDKGTPVVLAVAEAAGTRQRIYEWLRPELAVCEVPPGALADPVPYLDAAAAVVVLRAGSTDKTLEALAGLATLPAARACVLVLDAARDELTERALEQLEPAQVLCSPVNERLLRWAVQRALPSATPGAGAREGQRPAAALLGVSTAIREVIAEVRRIAPVPLPALILGETGTGKELVARAIHEQSGRAAGPFVAVNCAALPDTLLESELFGHRRGAFTGADRDKLGLFEDADGGTLFLDEIGDTSPALQTKLLRVLETGEVRPLGDTRVATVDVRIVSATHRDLEAGIEAGTFRQDLYYRLNAATLALPPLRRRRVDVPFLAQHFAEEFGSANARRITLSEDFLDSLSQREFPGNVRELRNSVERAIALAGPSGEVKLEHLDARGGASVAPAEWRRPLKELVDRVEHEALVGALERADGNLTQAAEALGITRPGLRYKLRRLGIPFGRESRRQP